MNTRYHPLLAGSLIGLSLLDASPLMAQEVGQVLSRTPIYQQVAVPRQNCTTVQPMPATNSGGGALLGAVVGGLVGNALGGGDSRGMATMAGAVGGAILGDRAETQQNNQPVTTCNTQTTYENRLLGYQVVYEYAGKQYQVQLAQDPGPTLPLQITPTAAPAAPATAPVSSTMPATPVVVTPAPVVYAPPAVVYASPPVVYGPAYGYRPWPFQTHVHLGWHHYSGGHRHWR